MTDSQIPSLSQRLLENEQQPITPIPPYDILFECVFQTYSDSLGVLFTLPI